MKYIELTVHTSTAGSELVADIFWDYTGEGVAISDVNDVIGLARLKRGIWDYVDDGVLNAPRDVLVKGYLPLADADKVKEIGKRLAALKESAEVNVGSLEVVRREVEGDAWLETWKEHFRPIKLGRVVVCPEWIAYTPQEGEIVTKIDSNMAFGTGEHETTAMCIELLEKYLVVGARVADVGCGSGILGITAKKLGAAEVLMTDIDENAVEAARHNAAVNGVDCSVRHENLLDGEKAAADLLMANIMAEVLIGFAAGVKNNVADGGVIILSGILDVRLEAVTAAYKAQGFALLETREGGEWRAVAMKKERAE